MGRFLKVLKVAGDVAEIIVASSIVVELIERYRAKKTAQVITTNQAANQQTEEAEVTQLKHTNYVKKLETFIVILEVALAAIKGFKKLRGLKTKK